MDVYEATYRVKSIAEGSTVALTADQNDKKRRRGITFHYT